MSAARKLVDIWELLVTTREAVHRLELMATAFRSSGLPDVVVGVERVQWLERELGRRVLSRIFHDTLRGWQSPDARKHTIDILDRAARELDTRGGCSWLRERIGR